MRFCEGIYVKGQFFLIFVLSLSCLKYQVMSLLVLEVWSMCWDFVLDFTKLPLWFYFLISYSQCLVYSWVWLVGVGVMLCGMCFFFFIFFYEIK